MTFIEFVQSSPGMTGYAVEMYRIIDKEAERVGARIITGTTSEELRARKGTPFVEGVCRTMADALEKDPTGKLAAVPALRNWAAGPDGIGQTWVNWFVTYYCAYLDAQKAPKLVPAMAE